MAVTTTRRGLYSDDSDIAFNTTEVRDGREDFRIDRGLRHVNPVRYRSVAANSHVAATADRAKTLAAGTLFRL